MYRLCYMRGPAGIIVALAEELSGALLKCSPSSEKPPALYGPERPFGPVPGSQPSCFIAYLRLVFVRRIWCS